MCGRFTRTADVSTLAGAFPGVEFPDGTAPRYNIAPTQPAVVIVEGIGPGAVSPRAVSMVWGLIPHWAKDRKIGHSLINARAETLAEKPSFRTPFRDRRCLVVADGFYEWRKEAGRKVPMYIRIAGGRPFAFAGLWDSWRDGAEEVRTFTIITTASNGLVGAIHDRMPAIIPPDGYAAWLDVSGHRPESVSGLLVPYPSAEMEMFGVSAEVNDPRAEGPGLVVPAGPAWLIS
ncbi:MAG: SOS response-associated peptidase [Nitrospirae bacterium]|nr:SOS response-associated peptidase [Nitrospirota bacterium]